MDEFQQIACKLEYRLINVLEESVMRNIQSLLDEQPSWILEKEFCDLYNVKKKKTFNHNISLICVCAIELSILLLLLFFKGKI